MDKEIYEFVEPHVTGGNATIRITRREIILYMRDHPEFTLPGATDDALVEQFRLNTWAHLVGPKPESKG